MGFIKWLLSKYHEYQLEQSLPKLDQFEKDKIFINAYYRCIEVGFTTEELNSLISLFCISDSCVKKERV